MKEYSNLVNYISHIYHIYTSEAWYNNILWVLMRNKLKIYNILLKEIKGKLEKVIL